MSFLYSNTYVYSSEVHNFSVAFLVILDTSDSTAFMNCKHKPAVYKYVTVFYNGGTVLEAGRSRDRFMTGSLEFLIHLFPLAAWPWDRLGF